MTIIATTGTAGFAGINGAIPGADGTAGGAGGDALPPILNDAGNTNQLTATGGAGGNGGNGADNPDGIGGAAGAGGTGGAAVAPVITAGGGGPVTGTATAIGGAGGVGGVPGNVGASTVGANANGGTGGTAQATAGASAADDEIVNAAATATGGAGGDAMFNANGGAGGAAIGTSASATDPGGITHLATATAFATGGAGGTGVGVGNAGGAGGVASGTTAFGFDGAANVSVAQAGGAGGRGDAGANGGAGADSTLLDAATGSTSGGSMTLTQSALGGAGGFSNGGVGGTAGSANSSLTTNSSVVGFLAINSNAIGGAGGGSSTVGTSGGLATASANLTDSLAGSGALLFGTAPPPLGLHFGSPPVTPTPVSGQASAAATGGAGGAGADGGGDGGSATIANVTSTVTSATSNAIASATAIGGVGGIASASGVGGAGGTATIAPGTVFASGTSALAIASQTGGGGGAGFGAAAGGAGTDSSLTNAVGGHATGILNLQQSSVGGAGGNSAAATGGAGGNGASTLVFDDTLANVVTATTLQGGAFAGGGAGGSSGGNSDGGIGGSAVASTTFIGAQTVSATPATTQAVGALGGTGGAATGTGNGGIGGSASNSDTAINTGTANVGAGASAVSIGGTGGSAANGGGGAGGTVGATSATASEVAEAGVFDTRVIGKGGLTQLVDVTAAVGAVAQATGGAGGTGTGVGNSGGSGGAVAGPTTASATGFDAQAIATQTGGRGGLGFNGANGGVGADSTLINGVNGVASGSTLTLSQTSSGGAGGQSNGGSGGNAGAAISSLTFDETANATQASNTNVTNNAVGGLGGNSTLGAGGIGGNATTTATIASSLALSLNTTATGGVGGFSAGSTTAGGNGGNANAEASGVSSTESFVTATAVGGAGGLGGIPGSTIVGGGTAGLKGNADATASATGALAQATATATGTQVSAHTTASTSNGVVTNATASTDETGAGAIQGFSQASNSNPFPALGSGPDAFGFAGATVSPGSGVLENAVSNNAAINAVLGASNPLATVLAMGKEHVISQAGTTGPQTITSTDTFTLNASSLGGTLVAGLIGGTGSFPAGNDSLTFTASVNGVVVEQDIFTSAADANAFFADHPLDLGATPQVDGTQVALSLTLTTDGSTVAAGFDQTFVLGTTGGGNPPIVSGPVTAAAVDGGAAVTVNALANASDTNPNAVLSVTGLPTLLPAGVTFNAATQSFTLDPTNIAYESLSAGQSKTVTVDFAVTDGATLTPASAVFTVTGVNEAPFQKSTLAFSASALSAAIAFDPLSNMRDVDSLDVLTVVPGTLPTGVHQTATGYVFDPNDPAFQNLALGQSETVVWNYGVSDGTVTVADSATFTVTGVEHAPIISGPVHGGTVLETAAPVSLNLLANASDVVPGAVLNVDSAVAPKVTVTSGAWTTPIAFSVVNNQLTIDPSQFASLAAGKTLSLNFNYAVTDGNPGGSVPASADITIQGTYAGPTGVSITDADTVLAHAQAGSGINSKAVLATFAETGGLAADTYNYTLGGAGAGSFTLATAGGVATLSSGNSTVAGAANGQLYALSITANDTTAGLSAPAAPIDVVVGLGKNSNTINLAGLAPASTSTPTFVYDLAGSDTINGAGMTGNLWFDGGQGADIMTGGTGANDYLYSATADSTSKSMDVITNFKAATDVVDFTGLGQKFGPVVALSSTATTLAADSIGYQTVGGNTFIYVNTGGNAQTLANANMQIELQGPAAITSNNILHL